MIKKLRIPLLCCFALFLGIAGGIFFYLRSLLPEIPHRIASQLKEKQIEFKFKNVSTKGWKLQASIEGLEISGAGSPLHLTCERLELGLLFKGWPTFVLRIKATSPEISANEGYITPKTITPTTAAPLKEIPWYFAILKSSSAEFFVQNGKGMGIEGVNTTFKLTEWSWTEKNIFTARVAHDLSIEKITMQPLIPPIHWSGETFFHNPVLDFENHYIQVGPLPITFKGKADVSSLNWSGALEIPENTDLGRALKPGILPEQIKNLSGKIGLNIFAQGLGANPSLMQTSGNISINSVSAEMAHPNLTGLVGLDMILDFKKNEQLSGSGKIKLELTKARVYQEKKFEKPSGVPFVITSDFNLTPSRVEISNASVNFNNLNLKARGSSSLTTPFTGSLWADISPLELAGWERFVPIPNFRSEGILSGNIDYKGNFQEWKTAEISLNLLAKHVKIPLLKEWFSGMATQIQGVVSINSQTKLSLGQGQIRSLATDSLIDLSQSQVDHGTYFHKPKDQVFTTELRIKSTANKAKVEKGSIQIANSSLNLNGAVENFTNPMVKLSFQSSAIRTEDLMAMAPKERLPEGISNTSGRIALKGTVSGLLMDKNYPPQVAGALTLSNVALKFRKPHAKDIIDVRRLMGSVSFSNDSVSTNSLLFSLPGTEGKLNFSARNFDSPSVDFKLVASRLQIRDFTTLESKTPPTVAGPIAKNSGTDPRENPYAKKLSIIGDLEIKNADLGNLKAESIQGKFQYKNLKLNIDPLIVKTFSGTITSKTEWDGNPKIPHTKQTITTQGVEVNSFLSAYSENSKDIFSGKLNSNLSLVLEGLTPEEMKKTVVGKGNFELENGKISSLRLTKGPLESLKKFQIIGSKIKQTDFDEKIQNARGSFKIENGRFLISGLSINSGLFDAISENATLSIDQDLSAKMILYPKDPLIPLSSIESLKDNTGRPSLPLTLSGKLRDPSVTLDSEAIHTRVKAFIARRVEEEKSRAISSAKEKASKVIEDQVKGQMNKFFK